MTIITVDTNILVRSTVRDDPEQTAAADKLLREDAKLVVTLPCLCEFFWVLQSVYRFSQAEIVSAIRALIDTDKVVLNRQAVEAGLALLEDGGDFADGLIAFEGRWMGSNVFASFDRSAVKKLSALGYAVRSLR